MKWKQLLVFIAVGVCLTLKVTESDSRFGTFNFPELEYMKYEIYISPQPKCESDASIQQGGHLMTSHFGQKYVCFTPAEKVDHLVGVGVPNTSEMLQPLSKTCLRKTLGWWTYEYCHGASVRQLHLDATKVVKEVVLGYYSNETEWTQDTVDSRKDFLRRLGGPVQNLYHRVSYVNGTLCEKTGKNRTAKVQISCLLTSNSMVLDVKEVDTCRYLLHIGTPHMCTHPLFTPVNQHKADVISCSPILGQEEFDKFQRNKELEKQQETTPLATPLGSAEATPSSWKLPSRDQNVRELVLQALSTLFSDFDGLFEEEEGQEGEGQEGEGALGTDGGPKPLAAHSNSPAQTTGAKDSHKIPSSISSRFRTDDNVKSSNSPRSVKSNSVVAMVKVMTSSEGDDIKDGSQGNKAGDEGSDEVGVAHMEGGKATEDSQGDVKVKIYTFKVNSPEDLKRMELGDFKEMDLEDLKEMDLEDLKEMGLEDLKEMGLEDLKEMDLEDLDLKDSKKRNIDDLEEIDLESLLLDPTEEGEGHMQGEAGRERREGHMQAEAGRERREGHMQAEAGRERGEGHMQAEAGRERGDANSKAVYESLVQSVTRVLESVMQQDEQTPKDQQKQQQLESSYRHSWVKDKKDKTRPK